MECHDIMIYKTAKQWSLFKCVGAYDFFTHESGIQQFSEDCKCFRCCPSIPSLGSAGAQAQACPSPTQLPVDLHQLEVSYRVAIDRDTHISIPMEYNGIIYI